MSDALKAPGFRGILLMVVMFMRACVRACGEKKNNVSGELRSFLHMFGLSWLLLFWMCFCTGK